LRCRGNNNTKRQQSTGTIIIYKLLLVYKNEFEHLNIPLAYTTPDGWRLGEWASEQRLSYSAKIRGKKTGITDERVAALNTIGFPWNLMNEAHPCHPPQGKQQQQQQQQPRTVLVHRDYHDLKWDYYYNLLLDYKDEFKHLNVPQAYTTPDSVRLGQWVRTQRAAYSAKLRGKSMQYRISDERIAALSTIGFSWTLLKETHPRHPQQPWKQPQQPRSVLHQKQNDIERATTTATAKAEESAKQRHHPARVVFLYGPGEPYYDKRLEIAKAELFCLDQHQQEPCPSSPAAEEV
jgi:Helicase associated domain